MTTKLGIVVAIQVTCNILKVSLQLLYSNVYTYSTILIQCVRHVTGTGSGLLGGIPRVVVQMSALTLKGPL
jgi:hypothetical protein